MFLLVNTQYNYDKKKKEPIKSYVVNIQWTSLTNNLPGQILGGDEEDPNAVLQKKVCVSCPQPPPSFLIEERRKKEESRAIQDVAWQDKTRQDKITK
jgi:hypothetical protein